MASFFNMLGSKAKGLFGLGGAKGSPLASLMGGGGASAALGPLGSQLSPMGILGSQLSPGGILGSKLGMPQVAAAIPGLGQAQAPLAQQGQSLPQSPPKSPSIWDKQHISDTLLSIGTGFLSEQDFGRGMAAAAQGIQGRRQALKGESAVTREYGGPDNQFEIVTDAQGNRTVNAVPEFQNAIKAKRDAVKAPTAMDNVDLRGRAIYAIGQLPPEQRATAYQGLIANPQQYGIDATGMPEQWDDSYASVASPMALSLNQTLNQTRAENVFRYRQGRDIVEDEQFNRAYGQRQQFHDNPPPSRRRSGGSSGGFSLDDLNY